MTYSTKVIDYCENPRHVGSFENAAEDPNIGTGFVGAPACGDMLKFQIKVKDNIIIDALFKTFGCGSAIASSAYTIDLVMGKTLDEALAIKNSDIVGALELPKIKIHCSIMAEEAIQDAIEDYREKQRKLQSVA